MGFQCGIVGLPNVGKSTLFNALTKATIEAQNYPFCTIEPNVGMVPLPDNRLDAIAAIVNPQKVIPTTVKFVDIAGLVKGASQGEGLGNQFLANIREVDAIAHVVRCFINDDIVHVNGTIDPLDDIATTNTELQLADIESVEKALQKATKLAKGNNKQAIAEQACLNELLQHLEAEYPARTFDTQQNDLVTSTLQRLQLLTAKPVMYIANVDENGFTDNQYLQQVQELAKQQGAECVAICCALEAEIAELDGDEKQEFLNDIGLDAPGLDRVILAGYQLLNLETYFTAGEKEVRAWTIKKGSSAPQAAGVIHTDFEKGFIRAEVVNYHDFIQYQGEQGAKEAGKWRLEGKEYIMHDGDVVHFRFNV